MSPIVITAAGLALLLLAALAVAVAAASLRRLGRSLAEVRGRLGRVETEAERLREAQEAARRAAEEERRSLAAAREASAQESSPESSTQDPSTDSDDELWSYDSRSSVPAGDAATPALPPLDEGDVYSLALHMEEFFNRSTYPRELTFHQNFAKGVALFKTGRYGVEDLTQYARGSNTVLACMALQALAEREDGARAFDVVLQSLNDYYYWVRHYALEALRAHGGGRDLVAEVLLRVNSSWTDYAPLSSLREFVRERVAAGERVAFGERLYKLTDEEAAQLGVVLNELRGYVPNSLIEELEQYRSSRVDTTFMQTFGRVREPGGRGFGDGAETVVLDVVKERVAEIETALRKNPPRSVMVVGDSGTGKTTVIRVLAERFMREGWTILEASATDVLAGQKYIGELEGRVQTLVRQISGRRVLWVIPNFHEILWAGQHQYSPVGVLDMILPSIESGELKVVGELTSVGYENLIRLKAKLRSVMQTVRVAPMSDAETLELARRWAERREVRDASAGRALPRLSDQTLREAFQLTKQYLSDKAAPGNLILLLDSTHRRLLTDAGGAGATKQAARQISLDDLLVTLSQLTGLPVQILDDRAGLDLTELRAFFERRVLGQPEAVECLTERVAMIKAGLTDPTRPQGVFLFVGPTGTGKTEIAKTLAEFLFGSPDRMIRLDMSEFQTAESLDRIIGESLEHGDSQALVNSIRKQPFSVILLDEFEKAHPNVWDLFLQVFDDGRLTDRRGNTADFRHSVVIMTSNLGATLPHGASIGFSQEQAQFASSSVERAVGRAFRREFINRIDRVVVFRPLGLSVMRDLLRKELQDVLSRRGFRMRQWAVEWDESAIDFLLQKGFTADLGARPLKRAVERYVLSPLAMTIVNHQFPEGDQFLFVRARDGRIDVQFIDPDAPEESRTPAQLQAPAPRAADDTGGAGDEAEPRLSTITLDARGTRREVDFLEENYRRLRALADSEEWRERKNEALLRTAAPDFWDSPARFAVLGLAEYMDRIEAGLDTAGSLLARLTSGAQRSSDRKTFLPELVCRVAQQLYLLDAACRAYDEGNPRDAFLSVQAVRETGADLGESNAFARRVAEMYGGWAEKRRMRFEVIEEVGGAASGNGAGAPEPYRLLAAVSGFAAYTILSGESGLHVLETPQADKSFHRAKVQVRVVAQPEEPAGRGREAQRRQAEHAFAAEGTSPPATVRRYREDPSPLVRDSARGWRTGKLERVLAGDFDLF